MQIANMRLATKLWSAMALMVLSLVLIIAWTAMQSRVAREAFGIANEKMGAQIKDANQLALLEDANATRAYAVVVSTDPGVARAFKDEISSGHERIEALQTRLLQSGLDERQRQQLDKLSAMRRVLQDLTSQTALLKVTKPAEMPAFLDTQYRPALRALQQAHEEFVAMQDRASETLREDFDAESRRVMAWSLGGLVLAFAGVMVGAAFMIRSIQQPLAQANDLASRIAQGDLSAVVDETRSDEFGDLMRSLAAMNRALSRMVSRVRQSTDSIATASTEIAAGNNDLAHRTEDASSNLASTASSMDSLTHGVRLSSDNAQQAGALAEQASQVAEQGSEVVTRVVHTMQEIDSSSKRIADIIGVIDGIAFQTNILALNAAVEAARAGEQGRGFAVVASEVRSLAGRSAEAAREIKALIASSVEKVESGTQLVNAAGTTMQDIMQSVRRVAEVIHEITAASSEQSAGIVEVNQAVSQLDRMTQQNAALVEQSAAAAESLREQAAQLAQAVSVFKMDAQPEGTPTPWQGDVGGALRLA